MDKTIKFKAFKNKNNGQITFILPKKLLSKELKNKKDLKYIKADIKEYL